MSDVCVEGLLGILRLDFPNLLNRFRPYQLLKGAGTVLERFLGIIDERGADSLEAFAHLTIGPHGRIEPILARLLKLFTKLLNVGHALPHLAPASAELLPMC